MPTALSQFLRAFDGCTDAEDAEHAARRRDMFTRFDTNANGYISLAECGAGILLSLSRVAGRDATSLYHRYYRSYIRAFNDAKDAAVARAGHALDDDYVTKTEFRLLLRYLCVYATWCASAARKRRPPRAPSDCPRFSGPPSLAIRAGRVRAGTKSSRS